MMATFLLEIGIEEMPARFVGPAMAQLEELARAHLAGHRLEGKRIRVAATPRRLAIVAEGLPPGQPPLLREAKGPAVKVAFDASGRPTKAATGFARSQGVPVEELVRRRVGDVEYVFAVQEKPGRSTLEVLREAAPALIGALSFPKPMRWGDLDFAFIRPIRWLVALLDEVVIDFELAGCRSGRLSQGHRVLGGPVELASAAAYFDRLREAFVIADPGERKNSILAQIRAAAAGGRVLEDPELLEEVTNLVEYPTALAGRIEAEYLSLPRAVLITSMREHQRYFPVEASDGTLLPMFVTVANSSPAHLDIVRAGNERVLRARLADAAFFYREDRRRPLADRVEDLRKVVYLEGLGTMYDRTSRVAALAGWLGGAWGLEPAEREHLGRAALLAKADLTTAMVYEFPELQGVMGAEYARADGEHEAVALAIYEHYLPRLRGDELPESPAGVALALADKMDHICALFSQNLLPSGSQDPYALRRQALGICQILLAGGRRISLSRLVDRALEGLKGVSFKLEADEVRREVLEFFRARVRGLFLERGLAYDTVDAVVSRECDDIADAWARAAALQEFRSGEGQRDLMAAYIRAYRLSRDAAPGPVRPSFFEHPAEEALHRRLAEARSQVQGAVERGDYGRALSAFAGLAAAVEEFFNAVMVMVDDPGLRENRLALLQEVVGLGLSVADLSRLAG